MEQLRDVFHQMKHDFLPQCTYCVNSGHGLHLYYLFEKPVPLYRHLQDQLREFKYELIRKIWHIKRDLYDWWLRKIQSGAVSVGHRYWCLSVLAFIEI